MPLKQTGHCLGVLLVYTVTITTLARVCWCEPTPPRSHRAAHNVRNRDLTAEGRAHPATAENAEPHGDRSPRPGATMASASSSDASQAEWVHSSGEEEEEEEEKGGGGLHEACSRGSMKYKTQGKFYLVGQLEADVSNAGYQSDSALSVQAAGEPGKVRGQWLGGSDESWQRLQPVVECGGEAMSLVVRLRRAGHLQLDRVNESSVPLSQLPPQCGYSVHTTWRDLSLMVQYDACHVTMEDDSYVQPLLWRGNPVKMSCPVSPLRPATSGLLALCCSPRGMTVKAQDPAPAEELRINVRGEWSPVVILAEQCGFTLEKRDAEILITAPYLTCGMTLKDGKYTLNLQVGEKTFTLSCPVSPSEDLPHHLRGGPGEPFPWATPLYLAPLYYPHPTYRHDNAKPDARVEDDSHSSSTSDPAHAPQPAESPPEYPERHSQQVAIKESYKPNAVSNPLPAGREMPYLNPVEPKQGTLALGPSEKLGGSRSASAGLPDQTEAPRPPGHAFNPYYHYYHHPKTPELRHPEEELSSAYSLGFEFPVMPQSEPFTPPEASSHPPPALREQPYPYPYFYYSPHLARGEAQKLAPPPPPSPLHHGDSAAKSNPSAVQPRSRSSLLPGDYEDIMNPPTDQGNSGGTIHGEKHRADVERRKKTLLAEDAGKNPEPDSTAAVTPAVQRRLSPREHPEPDSAMAPPPEPSYHLHPHYYYSQLYFGPESVYGAENIASPTSPEAAPDPQPRASSSRVQPRSHRPPQTRQSTTYDAPPHPHDYYYNLLHRWPRVSQHHREPDPAAGVKSQVPSDPASHGSMDSLVRAARAEYPSMHQPHHRPLGSHYYLPFPNPQDPLEYPGEEAEWNFRLGDSTTEEHFVFVDPPSHPYDESKVSCMLQRLTSDPGVYVVFLEDCEINRHVFGQTVVNVIEVPGISSFKDDYLLQENSLERSMEGCHFSPVSPDESKLQVVDEAPPPLVRSAPATFTVQLRVATDESFSSYLPEAHLPLSFLRGRPLYLEVSVPDPPDANLVLLVHSCLAYTQGPYSSWMPIYDGCPSRYDSQLLPSHHPHHIRRILISSFLFLPSENPPYMSEGGHSLWDDPEIYFLCLTEVCSASDGDCSAGCIDSPNSDMGAMK